MKRPIKGTLNFGEQSVEVLGMIADDHQRRREVGHIVIDDPRPLLVALGSEIPIMLKVEPHEPVSVSITTIDLFTKTVRFNVDA